MTNEHRRDDPLVEEHGARLTHHGRRSRDDPVLLLRFGRVHGWPVRSEEEMVHALALGVDGTTVDDAKAGFQWNQQAATSGR